MKDPTQTSGSTPTQTWDLEATVPGVDVIEIALPKLDPTQTSRSSLLKRISDEGATGRYERGEQVGAGAMGVVSVAQDHDLGRLVAMKQLSSASPEGTQVKRFLREAQITGQLEHPGIVPVHDVGFGEDSRFYYVMRYVPDHVTLGTVIEKLAAGDEEAHRHYTTERRVRIVQQVAETLHHAHQRGVVHRDVKPENIVLGQLGEVYLVDWGVAKILSAEDDAEPNSEVDPEPVATGGPKVKPITTVTAKPNTVAGALVGTPIYMAPEQSYGKIEPRSDLYSLCAVLYEFLALRHYLFAEPEDHPSDLLGVILKIKEKTPTPAENFFDDKNGRVPRALSMICEKGLQKDPANRYATALELNRDLDLWLEGESPVVCATTFCIRRAHQVRKLLDRRPHLWTWVFVLFAAMTLLSLGLHVLQLALWATDR